jgi:hypothetical protein
VFSAPPNNSVYKISRFQFRVDLKNKEHKNLYWFRPLVKGNIPTSSGLILIEIGVIKGEQRD